MEHDEMNKTKCHLSRSVVVVLVSGIVGCASDSGGSVCPQGSEQCDCYPNDTCDEGLTCASHLCVMLGAAGTGVGTSGGGSGGTELVSGGGTSGGRSGGTELASGGGATSVRNLDSACAALCAMKLPLGCTAEPSTESDCLTDCTDPLYNYGCDTA